MTTLASGIETNSFSDSYAVARPLFLSACDRLPKEMHTVHKVYRHPLSGPAGEELACDVLFASYSQAPRQVLVVMSATHGVEGFAGSAIQVDCLPLLVPVLRQNPNLGIVFIHAMNPWGFAWHRRCDHEGIDINRNFVDFAALPAEEPDFSELYTALTTQVWTEGSDMSQLWQGNGFEWFTNTITRGHYKAAEAPFFGGHHSSWSRTTLEQITAEPFITHADRVAVIDIHTGLGPYGYGELINDHIPATAGFARVEQWYGNNAASAVMGESCSGLKSGLVDYHWHEVIGERGCFVTLEFGTFSVLQLLTSLINEQLYHNDCVRQGVERDPASLAVQALKRFFNPAEKSWQQQVLFRGRQVLDMALSGIQS
ncbi:MAG: M14 family metallopeptidase [Gammaproteobacteria bacterium]|nr:M14 family metallopeptidase [Gammaproteobacteria bacterium]MDH5592769.1 M14 family metallopeptidase [Gammaproteobacteria bacterium]